MDAREVLAGKLPTAYNLEWAQELIDALHAAGFTIIHRDENQPKIAVLPNGTGVCIGGRWNGWQFRKHPSGGWISEMPLEMVDPMEGSPLAVAIRAMGEKK